MIFVNPGKKAEMGGRSRPRESDLDEVEAKVLPAREALSLIWSEPLSGYGVEDIGAYGGASADETASRLPDTDAAASGGGEESVTSEDRTIESKRTDSASSQT